MFEKLRDYRVLAWDVDHTLVNHPRSPEIWRFIKENPYDQVHHIVTMRSHGMEHMIFPDLEEAGSDLTRDHFSEIVFLEDKIWESYDVKGKFQLLTDDEPYFHFKGEACKRLGAEILIDDMENSGVSAIGCDKHGIPYIHPDNL